MKRLLAIIVLGLMISGCATVEELNYTTPSGKPEVLIQNANIKNIKSQIINDYLSKGGTIEKESDFSISILIENKNFMGQVLLGTEAGGYKNYERLTFNFAKLNSDIKVFGQHYFVTGYNTTKENANLMESNSSLNQMMSYLKTLKY